MQLILNKVRLIAIVCSLIFAMSASFVAKRVNATTLEPSISRIEPLVDGMYPELEALYKDIHANPELGFKETRTAAKLASEMRSIGFEVTEKVGVTGIVAIYKNGPGPTVLVRTELDALPMEEKTGLPYASEVKVKWNGGETFVAHSCGHDIHMASWIGTARTLVSLKDQWRGTLMFIGQPAEEIGMGAKAMLAAGLFKRFPKPDVAFALHTHASPYGFVGYRVGPVTSNVNSFEITFNGRGGHGSAPNKAIDPILIAARFVADVQAVISREKDPAEFGVITIGSILGGTVGNIIPDSVLLKGTIRSYKPEVHEKMLTGIKRTAQAVAAMSGAPEPVTEFLDSGASVINDQAVVQRSVAALKAQLGAEKVVAIPAITSSEDFSEFVNEGVPSMFFFIGVSDPKEVSESLKLNGKPLPFNHSPFFAPVPEPSIKLGVKAMAAVVLSAMNK